MKNLFKWTTLMLVASLMFNVACSEDEEPKPDNTPDVVGQWKLSGAVLIDGNIGTETADNLVVAGYSTTGGFITLDLAPGQDSAPTVTALVGGALADNVCTDPASYGTFFLELTEDGKMIFNCPEEQTSEEGGSWDIIENADGSYTV